MVECHVVLLHSHSMVLGFDWFHSCTPHNDWWACTLLVKVLSGHCLLAGLPCKSTVYIELASLDSICKEID